MNRNSLFWHMVSGFCVSVPIRASKYASFKVVWFFLVWFSKIYSHFVCYDYDDLLLRDVWIWMLAFRV